MARTLADLEASEACVAAALLHNVLDAGMLTEQRLRESMPADIADTVCNVSKLAGICQVRACRGLCGGNVKVHLPGEGPLAKSEIRRRCTGSW